MSLKQRAMDIATNEKYIAERQADNANRERGTAAADWIIKNFGLTDVEWISCEKDTWYEQYTAAYGARPWRTRNQWRHQIRVDDVMFGLSYGPYNTESRPILEVIYVTCPTCGDRYGAPLGYVSTIRDADENRAGLLVKVGNVLTADKSCTRCAAQPCGECGRPL